MPWSTGPSWPRNLPEVARAEVHYHEELARPWIPTFRLGYNTAGVFGGGSNVVPPTLAHFGGRSDFDVSLFWTIMNLGAGNISLQNRRYAILGEAEAQRVRVINLVRQEISSASAEALAVAIRSRSPGANWPPRRTGCARTPNSAAITWAGPSRCSTA